MANDFKNELGELGKSTPQIKKYSPDLLFPIPRQNQRNEIPYYSSIEGIDLWTCYELSWLNLNGKPQVSIITLSY